MGTDFFDDHINAKLSATVLKVLRLEAQHFFTKGQDDERVVASWSCIVRGVDRGLNLNDKIVGETGQLIVRPIMWPVVEKIRKTLFWRKLLQECGR